MVDADVILREVNRRHGTDFSVRERFAGPVNAGALLVEGEEGERILKWVSSATAGWLEAQRNAQRVTRALATKGYPVPKYEHVEPFGDGGYVLMTKLPGEPADFRAHGLAQTERVLGLNRLQYRAAVLPAAWPAEIASAIASGGDGYCHPDAMRRHSLHAASLLSELQRLGAEHAGVSTVADGVVHKDLNPGNVLAVGGHVTGVVDWENTTSGDPAYDVAYLWFCIYDHEDCRAALWRHLVGVAEPATIALYAAHIIIGFASGAIVRQPERVDRRLDAASRALADVAALGIRVGAL
ncbi:MAG TPA: aminoglycoside phosphotransferase family protein [Candidatus Limnocylindria bacterium]|nr:aminoglycoside phosphotransferase family protein [Candidatus Limnocylindria bacterium]